MNEDDVKLVVGALLHDIGKVIYRAGNDPRKHSQSGADYLNEKVSLTDKEVLDAVRYHHGAALRNADVADDSNAYLVYMADNIASASDRREKDTEESGFDLTTPIQPVFNILNGNSSNKYYSPYSINVEEEINYPTDKKIPFDREAYSKIEDGITDNLKGLVWSEEYINSLLEILEEELSYVPSSTAKGELPDISLYDHLKMTAAIALDEKKYLESQGINDYKKTLFIDGRDFYSVDAFRLASLDISGIQKFIYTITTKNALKTLRARSFYLEILMEHLIDELLESLGLCRANLIYSGGGHCYLLLPNTKDVEDKFRRFLEETNNWFLDKFGTQLYIAGASVPCSADSLKNVPEGSYKELFHNLSKAISGMKNHRYTPEQIISLNNKSEGDHTRECKVCHTIGETDANGLCSTCAAIQGFSAKVLFSDFFAVVRREVDGALPLPGGCSLIADDESSLKNRMKDDPDFVRAYGKNKAYTGSHVATKLWVGNYTTRSTFEEFSEESQGISRVGILRADVDNLGTAFVSGFDNAANHNRYVTISRTAAFSRQMSLFFKLHINKILSHPEFTLDGQKRDERKVTIVYSGGDDIFLVGAWNEVIEAAIDLRRALEKYSEGTLTISGGIGLYTSSYPISASAVEVERDVDESKSLPAKNAVTLLKDGETHQIRAGDETIDISDGTYSWKELEEKVIGEKFRVIRDYFEAVHGHDTSSTESEELAMIRERRGNSFLYHLLELIRGQDDKINFARYIYILSRMEPGAHSTKEIKTQYQTFKNSMIEWVQSEKDRRQLKTAIELYVYLNRSGKEEK